MKKITTLVLVFLGCMSSIGSTTFAMNMSDDQLLSEEVSNFYPQRNEAVDSYLNSVNNGLYGNASSFSCPICFGTQSRATIAQYMQTEHSENPMETPSASNNSSHEFAPLSLKLDDALVPTMKAGDTAQPTKKPTKKGQKKVYVSAIEKTKKSPSTSAMNSTQAYIRALKIERGKDGYACDEPGCTQKRRTIYQTAQHIIMHSGERAFECSVCKKNYTQQSTLNRHHCRGPVQQLFSSNSNSSSNSMNESMTDVADSDATLANSHSPLTPSTGCSVASNQVNDSTMSDVPMQIQHSPAPVQLVIPPAPQAAAPRALAIPMSDTPVSSPSNDANQVIGKKRARDQEVEENVQKPAAKKPRGLELLQLQKELYTAIDAGNAEGVKKILATGVSTNVSVRRTGKFRTPLELAIELGHLEIVKLLMQHDATQVNKANSQGRTPLMCAVVTNAPLITHALLQAKATTQTKSNSGETAMDYLITKVDKQHPNFGVLKFLLEQHAPSQKDEKKKSGN